MKKELIKLLPKNKPLITNFQRHKLLSSDTNLIINK